MRWIMRIITAWIITGCALGTPGSAPIDTPTPDTASPTETLSLADRCESKDGFLYDSAMQTCTYTQTGNPIITIIYPIEIADVPMIERTLDSYVTILLEQFETLFVNDSATSAGPWQLTLEPTIFRQGENIISVRWDETRYTGGANIGFEYTTFVFDLTEMTLLRFSDLFPDDVDALTTIQPLARATLTAQVGEATNQDAILNGTDELVEFDHFVLTDSDLILYFEPYTIGPGALGGIEISLPLSNIQGLRAAYQP